MPIRAPALFLVALAGAVLMQPVSMASAQATTVTEVMVRPAHHLSNPGADADAPTEKVSFKDLDIGENAGAHLLLVRIRRAAEHVCVTEKGDTPTNRTYKSCLRSAIADAVRDVGSALVTELYEQGD